MLMMRPYFFCCISGTTALHHKNGPTRLMASTVSMSDLASSQMRAVFPTMPALLTRRSTEPAQFVTLSRARLMSASEVTSPRRPMPPNSLATRSALSASRSKMATRAPARAKRVLMASPIPWAPPVTSATLPASAKKFLSDDLLMVFPLVQITRKINETPVTKRHILHVPIVIATRHGEAYDGAIG